MTAVEDRPDTDSAKEIGRDRRRKEDQRLITGRTRWTDNFSLPGMLHLAMVRSPFAHARIVSIDTEAAKAADNVVTVLTGADLGEAQGVCINAWAITTEQLAPTHVPMPSDRVAFAGETVAVVVARSAAAARDAAELVDVEYDELPAALDLKKSAADEVLAHPDLGTNKSAFWKFDSEEAGTGGNVDEAIEKARGDGIVIEREYRQQRLIPAFMEPRSTVVDPTGEQITMWTATQIPHILRFALAAGERRTRVEDPRHRARRGRRLRRQAPADAGGDDHVRGRPPARQAGEVHRDALGVPDGRPPRARPVAEAHPERGEGRHRHRPQGRADRRPGRLRGHPRRRRAGAGCVHVQRDLQVPGLPVQLPDGAHQQDLDRRLPRRRADPRRRTPSNG